MTELRQERLRANSLGESHASPSRGVPSENYSSEQQSIDTNSTEIPIYEISDSSGTADPKSDLIPDGLDVTDDKDLFTRNIGPNGAFKPKRVQEILKQVKIWPGLSQEQRQKVEMLIAEYADCFVLSVSEVRAVPDTVHCLNIPENAKFPLKVRQKTLTPP